MPPPAPTKRLRRGRVIGASRKRLDTAFVSSDTTPAGRGACLAANLPTCQHLPGCVMQAPLRLLKGLLWAVQLLQRPTTGTTPLHFVWHNEHHKNLSEHSSGCSCRPCCHVDTGLLQSAVRRYFGLPGHVPAELVCCMGCTQPVSKPPALPAGGSQLPNFRARAGPLQMRMLEPFASHFLKVLAGCELASVVLPTAASCDTEVLHPPLQEYAAGLACLPGLRPIEVPKYAWFRQPAVHRCFGALRDGDRLRPLRGWGSVAWIRR